MAKPDKDNGFIEVACELNMALALARFSHGARIVLAAVLDQTYGPGKPAVAVLDRKRLMKCGRFPQESHLRRAIKEAVDSGALSRTADGIYAFAKDYELWVDGDGPLLTPDQVEFCHSFRRFEGPKDKHESRTKFGTERTRDDTAAVSNPARERITVDTGAYQNRHAPKPLYEEDRDKRPNRAEEAAEKSRSESGLIHPMPDAYSAICRKADRMGFGEMIRTAWTADRKFRDTWEAHPDHPAWTTSLPKFADAWRRGEEADEPKGPRYYLAIVSRAIERSPSPRKVSRPELRQLPPAPPPPFKLRSAMTPKPKADGPAPIGDRPPGESVREMLSRAIVRIA